MSHPLTKSKFLAGLQCHKYLWNLLHAPDKFPESSADLQLLFEQGDEVGAYAKQLYPDGVDVPFDGSLNDNARATAELLSKRKPLFEAGFLANNLYARVDILVPVDGDAWDIIEVKSSTSVKDVHIWDVAFQRLCCELGGLTIRSCHIMLINSEYVRQGELDIAALLRCEDVTAQVVGRTPKIPDLVRPMVAAAQAEECPEITVGEHCTDPYACPLMDECWDFLPENSIFDLYRLWRTQKFDLLRKGVLRMEDIPQDFLLSDKQMIQQRCVFEDRAHVQPRELKKFLDGLEYPLYFLDFETFAPAVPLFDGTRPYQQVPFQYSLHILRDPGAEAEHHAFLAEGSGDPRPGFLDSLRDVIDNSGSVVVYNQSFEEKVLRDLADSFPAHGGWSETVIERMIDLIIPFRAFHYHHPDQRGSASLKKVLPVLTGRTYDNLNIQEGGTASRLFYQIIFKGESPEKKEKVREDLLAYCCLDTRAMIDILASLRDIVMRY